MAFKLPNLPKLLIFLLFWASPALLQAVTPPIPAHPAHYVVDLAGVFDAAAQARLNARLKDLEAGTTAQVVVLTLNSLEGEPIENFSHQTAVKWGIGQKGKDNGVLLTVAVKDRKYRIEVGYGLESILPDSLVGSIGRQYLVPNFKKGDFAGGIEAAVTEIIKIISKKDGAVTSEAGGSTTATPKAATPLQLHKPNLLTIFLLIVFLVLVIPAILSTVFRRRRGGGGFWYGGSSSGGWSSGGGDSGGFGGGGGDFGGGGASGDW